MNCQGPTHELTQIRCRGNTEHHLYPRSILPMLSDPTTNEYETPFLAFRNLARQRHRTLAALSAIALGVVALTLAAGFVQWNLNFGRESTIHSQLGHIQVFRPGFLDLGRADPFSYILAGKESQLAALRSHPHVRAVAQRLALNGLASHGDTTISFIGEGVEPAAERELSRSLRIVDGEDL